MNAIGNEVKAVRDRDEEAPRAKGRGRTRLLGAAAGLACLLGVNGTALAAGLGADGVTGLGRSFGDNSGDGLFEIFVGFDGENANGQWTTIPVEVDLDVDDPLQIILHIQATQQELGTGLNRGGPSEFLFEVVNVTPGSVDGFPNSNIWDSTADPPFVQDGEGNFSRPVEVTKNSGAGIYQALIPVAPSSANFANFDLTFGDGTTFESIVPASGSTFEIKLHYPDESGMVPAVPIPAAAWLLASALFAVIGIRRRVS